MIKVGFKVGDGWVDCLKRALRDHNVEIKKRIKELRKLKRKLKSEIPVYEPIFLKENLEK